VAEAGVGEALARVEEARSARLPRLGFDATLSRTTNPTLVFSDKLGQQSFAAEDFELDRLNDPDPLSNFGGSFSIFQPIYTGGATRGRIDEARAGHDGALSARERTRQQVVRDVIEAYTRAVLARNQLDVAWDSRETARANVKLVSDLHEVGLVVESDRLLARVRETEVEELVVRSESAVEMSRAALNLVLGRDLDTPFALPTSLEARGDGSEPLEELVRAAMERRPDLRASLDGLRAAEKRARTARSGYLPSVGATGLAEVNAEDALGTYRSNWSVIVGARFNLFDGKLTRARVRQATWQEAATREEHELLLQSIELEVRQAFYDRLAAGKRLKQASTAVELARESLRIVRDRYAEGLTTLVELLESETRLTQSLTREVAARRDLLSTGARLDLSVGRL